MIYKQILSSKKNCLIKKQSLINFELQQIFTDLFHSFHRRFVPLFAPVILSRYSLFFSFQVSSLQLADFIDHLLQFTIQLTLEVQHIGAATALLDLYGQFLQKFVNFHQALENFQVLLGVFADGGCGSQVFATGDLIFVGIRYVRPRGEVLFELAVGEPALKGVKLLFAGSVHSCSFCPGAGTAVVVVLEFVSVQPDQSKYFDFLLGFSVLGLVFVLVLLALKQSLLQLQHVQPELLVLCPQFFNSPLQLAMLVGFEAALASDASHYHLFYNYSDFYCNLLLNQSVLSSYLILLMKKTNTSGVLLTQSSRYTIEVNNNLPLLSHSRVNLQSISTPTNYQHPSLRLGCLNPEVSGTGLQAKISQLISDAKTFLEDCQTETYNLKKSKEQFWKQGERLVQQLNSIEPFFQSQISQLQGQLARTMGGNQQRTNKINEDVGLAQQKFLFVRKEMEQIALRLKTLEELLGFGNVCDSIKLI